MPTAAQRPTPRDSFLSPERPRRTVNLRPRIAYNGSHRALPGRAAPLASEGSVTLWIGRLRAGDPDAAGPLWERYFQRLVGLARARLRGAPRRVSDEEDVALSAFD